MDTGTVLKWGAIGIGAYLLYQWWQKQNPLNPASPTATAGGNLLATILNPGYNTQGISTMWRTTFPDGSVAYVVPSTIDNGLFDYNGQTYQMTTNADGTHTATGPVPWEYTAPIGLGRIPPMMGIPGAEENYK